MPDENLNMDFTQALAIETETLAWVSSPQPGVERRRLERQAAESGHATSIVRYAPGSSFPRHVHGGGEEYLVLDGVFSDQDGDFAAGSYVRNPPGSSHSPRTEGGCTIFVKLCQMQPEGEGQVFVDTRQGIWMPGRGPGHEIMPLHRSEHEAVTLERLSPGAARAARIDHMGEEILVLEGRLAFAGREYGPRTWIRTPPGRRPEMSSETGSTLWTKRGHMKQAPI